MQDKESQEVTAGANRRPEFKVAPGHVIFEQDSESNGVYLILAGEVEITREEGGETALIAVLSDGHLLGETSVIEETKRSVKAVAKTKCKLIFIPADKFRQKFADPLVHHVVTTLTGRLRSTLANMVEAQAPLPQEQNQGVNQQVPAQEPEPEPEPEQTATQRPYNKTRDIHQTKHPTLEGDSRVLLDTFLVPEIINEFPFVIGRTGDSGLKRPLRLEKLLRIPLQKGMGLQDKHFQILREGRQYAVQDLGTPYGTSVNGRRVTTMSRKDKVYLHPGRNLIVAGVDDSPVKFVINVPS